MKRFLVVLLSLGMVMALSMSAFAVTPDFTGQYYARGSYISNPSLLEQDQGTKRGPWGYYDQRLRMFFKLKIVEGVTFTTRADALETVWGRNQDLYSLSDTGVKVKDFNSPNFAFERTQLDFKTGIGQFRVGYQGGTPYSWGTKFMNAPGTAPGITWFNTFGPVTVLVDGNKKSKGDMTVASKSTPDLEQSDVDNDYYDVGVKYKFKGGEAGFLGTYFRYAAKRELNPATAAATVKNFTDSVYNMQPYAKMKFGPVDLEAEAYWMKGQRAYDLAGTADMDINTKGLYVNGKFNMGPAYVGGIFIYASGDDPTTTEQEGGYNKTLGYAVDTDIWGDISPAIMFADDYHDYLVTKGNAATLDKNMDNVFLYQLYGGFAVTKKLALNAKFSYMKADQVAAGYDDNYGKELDVKATYKIYDKLSYNVGAAYLWTGDYFKGTKTAKVENNYYLSHWIDLRF